MALHLHKSNRTERLVDALAEVAARPLARVFDPEWIVVSSPGMERWLSLQLADRLGVWANPEFPFPRKLIDSLLQALSPATPDAAAHYEATCMLFGIARELRERAGDPVYASVHRYCGDDPNGRRRIALAARLADLFDQYLSYRPDLMLDWAAGGGEAFQPALFRALCLRHGPEHLAARARRALERLASRDAPVWSAELPERIHLFGISSLPPLYLDLLSALSPNRELHLYVLSPSREYYGDLRSPRARRSERRQLRFEDIGFRSETHALLGSLGRHAREFQELLEEHTQYLESNADLYEDPGEDSLLHLLQSDLLALCTRGEEFPRLPLSAADTSIAIHACHSPLREVEVLHDQLVHLTSERGVEAHEIIVMTPDISAYAKVIDAVFSQPKEQRPQLPFRIADRGVDETQELLLALAAVLDVLESRFGANQVLDLLGFDLIRERFQIAIDQVESLREWLETSGIRWGVDASHRAEVDQPACPENTWQFGLQRLALGYSTGGAFDQLFMSTSPVPLESGEAPLLGQFFAFCAALFALRERFQKPAGATEWRARMSTLLASMFAERKSDQELAGDHKRVLQALRELEAHAERAGFAEEFDLKTLRSLLDRGLHARLPAQGFLSGGITFCRLLPMRSIPFKVVCLLGLNDGAFPASDTPFAFDEMQAQRRLGDRSRRDDDRQLFLEALLCARETLIITFVGQSQRDGKPLPPSVLVHELIDHAARSCDLPDQSVDLAPVERASQMEARLMLRHPLTSTSPRYFGADEDPRLFSYARSACKAARARFAGIGTITPFARLERPLGEPVTELSLRDLERCLMHPSREFCQRRLGLYLGDDLTQLAEREPFELDFLERWQVGSEWLEQLATGAAHRGWDVERTRGRLPLHAPGKLIYDRIAQEVANIQRELSKRTRGEKTPVDIDLRLDGVHVVGRLDDLWPGVHVRAQYSKLRPKHELRHFIRHVVLRAFAEQSPLLRLPEESLLLARGGESISFRLRDSAETVLRALLTLHASALRQPLPLFAQASRMYVEQLSKQTPEQALRRARTSWQGNAGQIEGARERDAYVAQLYPDFDAVLQLQPGAFERAATMLYEPLLQSRCQGEGDDD